MQVKSVPFHVLYLLHTQVVAVPLAVGFALAMFGQSGQQARAVTFHFVFGRQGQVVVLLTGALLSTFMAIEQLTSQVRVAVFQKYLVLHLHVPTGATDEVFAFVIEVQMILQTLFVVSQVAGDLQAQTSIAGLVAEVSAAAIFGQSISHSSIVGFQTKFVIHLQDKGAELMSKFV